MVDTDDVQLYGGVNLYPGDWVVVERPLLSVEGEVVDVFQRAGKLKIRVDGAKDVVTNVGDFHLHDEGRPSLRKERFRRFD
ncbi:hypothetical protein EGH25_08390 [Haladaptatus sp. F3-133]|jgi:hypothetical protein|uniref:Uncharacterized protein n=1 Tax=Halorutilus salinus TaxID=2487751 RepID=A0A9Q4GIZ5_9EURY|nr:hypothetical protein [Halorutilus salinus]MCX2819368.1 hypothetical protein [Halorutilus salinus]